MKECFVGIDLHRLSFTVCAQDEQGTILLRQRFPNSQQSIDYLINSLPAGFKINAVVEATRNWSWFVASLEEKGVAVVMAHPFRTKAIAAARIKTDSVDAKTLCDLLRTGFVPEAYRASREEQDNREVSRARIALVHDQTMVKNRIKAILAKENLNFSGSDLYGKSGRVWLEKQCLSQDKRFLIQLYLGRLTNLEEAIKSLDATIKEKSGGLPEVDLLTSIPGIGTTTAFLLASEIGNIARFDSSKKFASYFGLVPRLSQSGNHAYYGRITKLGNPYVRWSLVQAAHRLARVDQTYKRFVNRISYRGGKKKAIVALTRKLAVIVYCILKEHRRYILNPRPLVCPVILPGPMSHRTV